MGLEVRYFEDRDAPAWDEFVTGHPCGTPLHLVAWKKTIESVFRYKPYYLMATEAGQTRGVLPLFLVKNLLMGKVLLSTPFAVYGGILAACGEARQALAARAAELARTLGVEYLELRNASAEQAAGFTVVSRYVTFQQQVGPDEQAVLKSIPRKTRAAVRKGIDAGLATRIGRDLAEVRRSVPPQPAAAGNSELSFPLLPEAA